MATLAANDQENALRHLQAGAAGKSLNAGIKAPKTPFKVPLNDENAPNKTILKTNGKGAGNLFMTSKKGGKLDENAFVTPAGTFHDSSQQELKLTRLGPRTRAPLGMKTTNAKSRPFQTPAAAPLSSAKGQKLSPRLRRPKVKVHQPEVEAESEDDVPEVEYMPPKEIPLEDDMDDLPRDWNFPKIDHATMVRSIFEAYHNPVEDDGRTRKQREFEEEVQRERKQRDEEFDKVFEAQMAGYDAEARRYFGIDAPQTAPKPEIASLAPKRMNSGISTIRSRSAAAALAAAPKPRPTTTAMPAPRLKLGNKPANIPVNPSASRQAAATAASKSTIGYAQGRAGRTGPVARKPLSNITRPPPFSATARRTPTASSTQRGTIAKSSAPQSRNAVSRSRSSTSENAPGIANQDEQSYRTAEDLDREMELLALSGSNDEDDAAWMKSFNDQLQGDPFDDDLDDFQFQIPTGL